MNYSSTAEHVFPRIFLAGLLFLALLIRLPFVFGTMMGSDEALYAWCATQLAHDPSLIMSAQLLEFHPPLFPVLLCLGHWLPLAPDNSYRFIMTLMSLAGMIAIYALGKRVQGWFVGLFAAAVLAFHYPYLMLGILIYPEIPSFVLVVIFLWALAQVSAQRFSGSDVIAGLAVALLFLIKWSNIIFLPVLVAVYLFLLRRQSLVIIVRRIMTVSGLSLFAILWYSISKFLTVGRVLPDMVELTTGGLHPFPFWHYALNLHNIFVFPFLVPLFFYGVFILMKTHNRYGFLLLASILIPFLGLSITPIKNLRYLLIVLPGLLLVTGIGLDHLLQRLFPSPSKNRLAKIIVILMFCLIGSLSLPKTQSLLKVSFSTSTGLDEAADWIRSHTRPDTLVISQNLRPIRYYSGIAFRKDGGQLVLLPPTKDKFERLLRTAKGPVIVQVDLWSESNPSEFSPFWQEAREAAYFDRHGFVLGKEIFREIYDRDHQRFTSSVVKIYWRP